MKELIVPGIDGSEALGFLAGLGILRISSLRDSNVRMNWLPEGGLWHPLYTWSGSSSIGNLEELSETLSSRLLAYAQPADFGVAHLGEKIGVEPDIFRRHAENAVKMYLENTGSGEEERDWELVAAMLSASGSDGVIDDKGNIAYTSISFSNGGSAQLLLKDFKNAASLCTAEIVLAGLQGQPELFEITSLNWDPRDQRSAAHRWKDPAKEKALVDPVVNALAYIGMSYLTAMPYGTLKTIGWRYEKPRGFQWPLWRHPLTAEILTALLAQCADWESALELGIEEIRFSEAINPDGKRNYFAPSRSLVWNAGK